VRIRIKALTVLVVFLAMSLMVSVTGALANNTPYPNLNWSSPQGSSITYTPGATFETDIDITNAYNVAFMNSAFSIAWDPTVVELVDNATPPDVLTAQAIQNDDGTIWNSMIGYNSTFENKYNEVYFNPEVNGSGALDQLDVAFGKTKPFTTFGATSPVDIPLWTLYFEAVGPGKPNIHLVQNNANAGNGYLIAVNDNNSVSSNKNNPTKMDFGLATSNLSGYTLNSGLNFTVAAPLSSDDTLSALTVDGSLVTGFASGTTIYNVQLPAGTTIGAATNITATANNANATAVVTQATTLPGSATVLVTAQNGTTAQTYTVNFTVAAPPVLVNVQVQVEGATSTLLPDTTVSIAGSALDALNAAVGSSNVSAPGGFVSSIDGVGGNTNGTPPTGWFYYVIRNGAIDVASLNSGAGSYTVKNGDQVIWYIGAYDASTYADLTYIPVVSVSPSPTAGQSLTISVSAEAVVSDPTTYIASLEPLTLAETAVIGNYSVTVGGTAYTTSNGQVTIPGSAVAAGTLNYTVTNQNNSGYPNVVTYLGSINVAAATAPTTYTVTYNANGATGTPPTDSNTYAAGAPVTLATSVSGLVYSGYTFEGWSLTPTGAVISGSTLAMPAADTTLYAVWTQNSSTTYTVIFDSEGGSPKPASITGIASGATVTLPTAPTLAGDTFGGWFTAVNGGGTAFTAATAVTGNITVYALWYSTGTGTESFPILSATPSYFER